MTTELEERLAAYRPVLEAAIANHRDTAHGGQARPRELAWMVATLATGAVAACVAALWIVGTTATPDTTRPVDGQPPTATAPADVSPPSSSASATSPSSSFAIPAPVATVSPPLTTLGAPLPTPTADTATPDPSRPVEDPPPRPPLIAIGDSVMLGAAEELGGRGILVDAHESRQMSTTIPLVEQLRDAGQLGPTMVVHLGTNGPFSTETMNRFFDALADVPKVVVLTAHGPQDWIPPTNEQLYALPATYPNVVIVDWSNVANQCPGECFYDDGIHINQTGQDFYAQLIFDAVGR